MEQIRNVKKRIIRGPAKVWPDGMVTDGAATEIHEEHREPLGVVFDREDTDAILREMTRSELVRQAPEIQQCIDQAGAMITRLGNDRQALVLFAMAMVFHAANLEGAIVSLGKAVAASPSAKFLLGDEARPLVQWAERVDFTEVQRLRADWMESLISPREPAP